MTLRGSVWVALLVTQMSVSNLKPTIRRYETPEITRHLSSKLYLKRLDLTLVAVNIRLWRAR